jgi:hypothetical protein
MIASTIARGSDERIFITAVGIKAITNQMFHARPAQVASKVLLTGRTAPVFQLDSKSFSVRTMSPLTAPTLVSIAWHRKGGRAYRLLICAASTTESLLAPPSKRLAISLTAGKALVVFPRGPHHGSRAGEKYEH